MPTYQRMERARDNILSKYLGVTSQLLYDMYIASAKQEVYLSNDGHNRLKLNIVDTNSSKWGDSIQPNRYYKLTFCNDGCLRWIPIEIV